MLTKIIGRTADAAEVVVRRLGDAGGGRGRAVARRTIRGGRRTAALAELVPSAGTAITAALPVDLRGQAAIRD